MSLFNELKRRNVFRVALAFLVIGWLVAQVASTFEEAFNLPQWFDTTVISLLIIAFPIALVFSWAFELTPEGIQREKDIIRDESITQITSKKLDIVTLSAVFILFALMIWQHFNPQSLEQSKQVNSPPITVLEKKTEAETQSKIVSTTNKNSIAVLPFAHRSKLEDDLYFTDGIHDDLLTQLAKIQKLNVTSRTSVMQYRDSKKPIAEIAKELNVSTILEGGIQRAGSRIRINAQLIDVATDEHLWAETFDREMTVDNLFDIQSEITRQIVTAIKGQLTEQDELVLTKSPTQSIQAYESYLKAKETLFSGDWTIETYKKAENYLIIAIEQDANFALAQLNLSQVYGLANWFGYVLIENHQKTAEELIHKASINLPKASPELMLARGEYKYRFENNYGVALNYLLNAHMAMPSSSEVLLKIANTQRRLGLFEEAVDNYTLSNQLDPNNVNSLRNAGATLAALNQLGRLEQLLNKSLDKFPDNGALNNMATILPFLKSGDLLEYRQRVDNLPASMPQLGRFFSEIPLLIYERNFSRLIEVLETDEIQNNMNNIEFNKLLLGMSYKNLGEKKKSLEYFNTLIEQLNIEKEKTLASNYKGVVYENLVVALLEVGDFDKALNEIISICNEISIEKDQMLGMNLLRVKALVLARMGKRDEALTLLQEIIDKPYGFNRWHLYLHPDWDFIRDDERFNKLIKPKNFDESIHAKKIAKDITT
jgi:TolB-like protein/tetratricopeptide (TPR) repeat protein